MWFCNRKIITSATSRNISGNYAQHFAAKKLDFPRRSIRLNIESLVMRKS